MQGPRPNDPRQPRGTRPSREAHEFERDRGAERPREPAERLREFDTPMHDPRTGEAVPRRYLQGSSRPWRDDNRTDDDDRYPTGTMQRADSSDDATPARRELDTRFTGRGYHYPGGARYADPSGRRDARRLAHFDEHRSFDPEGRDDLWRRGEYGSRLYGNVVGAATPSGTAGIARYDRSGTERKGPKGYVRSDERLRDDICERLSDEPWIDLSEVDVHVDEGRVRLEGEVPDRFSKFAIEDIADGAWGVKDVDNRLKVRVQ